jgi:hypothetical protein
MTAEQNVREAAAALLLAVSEAKAAGLFVQWPSRPEGLASMAISQMARIGQATGVVCKGITVPADGKRGARLVGDGAGVALPVINLDGSPVERDADGVIRGEPLKLTAKQRAALPPLDPKGGAVPAERFTGKKSGKRKSS